MIPIHALRSIVDFDILSSYHEMKLLNTIVGVE